MALHMYIVPPYSHLFPDHSMKKVAITGLLKKKTRCIIDSIISPSRIRSLISRSDRRRGNGRPVIENSLENERSVSRVVIHLKA